MRVTRGACNHVPADLIESAVSNGLTLLEDHGRWALYSGTASNGFELEIGVIRPDDPQGEYLIDHAMPRHWRKRRH